MSEQEARAWRQDWDMRNEVIQEARLVRNETQRNALLEAYQKARMKLLVHGDRSALEQVLADVLHAREEEQRKADAYDGLLAQRDALLEVLKQAMEDGVSIVYDHEDDETGTRGCCGELSYKPHSDNCWVTKARAVIAKAEGK